MLSCNCLNVIIESETNDFQQVTPDSLNLTEEEKQDVFFKQDLRQVDKLSRINKEHSGLVTTRNVGKWILHQCLNCDVHTHAIHRDRGAACVLVSSNLLVAPSIETLRSSDDYSEVFNIVVFPVEDSQEQVPPENILYNPVQLALAGLKQRLTEAVNKEQATTEESVLVYSQQQYKTFDKFRFRANREHRLLSTIILNKRCEPPSAPLIESNNEVRSSPNDKMSISNSPLLDLTTNSPSDKQKSKLVTNTNKPSPRTARQMSTPVKTNNYFDSEGLFQLEEMEDVPQASSSDHEESDNEESKEESARIGRNSRAQPLSIAKSLPVNIPTFMSSLKNKRPVEEDDEEHDDIMSPPAHDDVHPSDIAASIKALAKSVHGDTVFGDLPRPRFSTQI